MGKQAERKMKEKWTKRGNKRGKKQRKKKEDLKRKQRPLFGKRTGDRKRKKNRKGSICGLGLLFEHMGIAKVLLGVLLISPLAWPATLCKTTSATSDVDIIHNCVGIVFLGALSRLEPSNSFQLQLVVSNMLLALPLAELSELSEFDAKCTVQRWSLTCSERIWRIIEWQGGSNWSATSETQCLKWRDLSTSPVGENCNKHSIKNPSRSWNKHVESRGTDNEKVQISSNIYMWHVYNVYI